MQEGLIPHLNVAEVAGLVRKLLANIRAVFIGKDEAATAAVLSLMADGHILLEDVPGVGKTLLAKAVAKSIDGVFKRIQFTADLLPSDITGVTVFHQTTSEFRFMRGPLFANVLLADEINRATPRTQSSLLEAMEEKQATVDGTAHPLDRPFLVIATQNPIEIEGTYPLPVSQMDRFMTRLAIGYLDKNMEMRMLKEQKDVRPIDALSPVIDTAAVLSIQKTVRAVGVSDEIRWYVTEIVSRTRQSDALAYGASPRATLDLMRFSQARALLDGRDYVLPDDVKRSAPVTLGHRVIPKKRDILGLPSEGLAVVTDIVNSVDVPI